MIQNFIPLVFTVGGILILSVAVYFFIRFFAYKRSFPLPHQYDFLWMVNTLLIIFLACSGQPPLEGNLSDKLLSWIIFFTFLLSTYLLIFVIDKFLVEYFLVSVLKIYIAPPLRKIIVLFVFAIAVVVGIQKIFNINPWAVYAPTSLLSLGVGLALKDAFQTFFAGVSLSRFIRIGDWLQLGEKEGEVVDINWARTVLRSWEGIHLFIPNSELQKGIFKNYSYRNGQNRCRIELGTSYSTPPQKVKKVLMECTQNVDGLVSNPVPEVLLLNYGDFSIRYALTFWIEDYAHWREITSEVSTRIWYAFKRENIEIPFPIRTVHMTRKGKEEPQLLEPETILSQIDLFNMIPLQDRQLVLKRLQKQVYLKNEIVVREGDHGSSFYVILKGTLEVLRKMRDRAPLVIGELKSGQFFGELSLLTGESRSATIRAVTDSELLRLEKQDFKEILERHPDLSESLAEIVASRQSSLSEFKESVESLPSAPQKKSVLSKKIRDFFNLKS